MNDGSVIKRLRRDRGWSTEEVAALIVTNGGNPTADWKTWYEGLEVGKQPKTVDQLRLLGKVFGHDGLNDRQLAEVFGFSHTSNSAKRVARRGIIRRSIKILGRMGFSRAN